MPQLPVILLPQASPHLSGLLSPDRMQVREGENVK